MNTGLRLLAAMMLVIVLMIPVLGLFLSVGKELEEWHVPSSFDESFDFASSSFADYIDYSERHIRASRLDTPSDEEVSKLLPYILEPDSDCPVNADGKYPDGIVLVHGLIASPWSMKPLAQHFNSRCFYVLGLLLPGHGSRPGDMLESTWEHWLESVEFSTQQLSDKTDRIFLSGHSVGGNLAVLEALHNSAVDALVLFAPAMMVTEASRLARILSLVGKLFPAAAWFELEPDDAVYRYESFPFRSAAETWSLIQETHKTLDDTPLSIPVFTVASAQDTTVDAQATFDFMVAQDNPLSFTLLYTQRELPPYNKTQVKISNTPDQGILGLGHLGLMTPADHPYYGRDGAYRYCGHYFGQPNDRFARCKDGERDFYGEPTNENLALGLIERIAFNPFYSEMIEELGLFLEQVSMDPRGLPIQREFEGSRLNLDN